MYLSKSNLELLRDEVENNGGFQIALAPMQPARFMNVKIATDEVYQSLIKEGFKVLVDDRNRKPKDMFEVIEFLQIEHRVVISSRSISAGVYEYKNLVTEEFVKVPQAEIVDFLKNKVV